MSAVTTQRRVVLAVCTHQRNDELRRLLDALSRNAAHLERSATQELIGRVELGVVIADDNVDGRANEVADEYTDRFALGVRYIHVGSGNISRARNASLEAGLIDSDFVLMTDDDCEPVDDWVSSFLRLADSRPGDVITGPCRLLAPPGAPGWITEQPFYQRGSLDFDDGAEVSTAGTNNSMLRSAFFVEHPEVRFLAELGVVGGEDMVFFRTARQNGALLRFATGAVVHAHESPERATFRYQFVSHFWQGNTEFVTNHTLGDAPRLRWAARSIKGVGAAVARPLLRLARRKPPEWRYALALMAHASGMAAGALGRRVRHH